MLKHTLWLLGLMLLLAACGGRFSNQTAGPTAVPPAAELISDEEPAVEVASGEAPATSEGTVYQIVPDGSEARFTLNEILRGNPTTVVGVTSAISGQITFDLNNPTAAQISPIEIDAASLATDQGMRNRAINNFILVTGSYPTITFTPTVISGIPAAVSVGEPVAFTITGDLTITNITLPVTFATMATAVSDARLEGTATATITRADFNLTIPNVPNVANVDEEVLIELDFVAEAN